MNTWIKRTLAVVGMSVIGFAAFAPTAEAGTAAGSFSVSTNVFAACTMTTNNLTFAGYTTGQVTPEAANTTVAIACPGTSALNTLPVTLTLSSAAASFKMANGANTLNYRLCDDAACTTVYANAAVGPSILLNSAAYNYTLYGEIGANQAVPVGAYAQTVNATLTY